MGIKEGKIWGVTELVLKTNIFELHKISVDKDGYCSKHKHKHKINAFYIIEGELEIVIWRKSGLVDKIILKKDDLLIVNPGDYHRFEAQTGVIALELYWAPTIEASDIIREIIGGKKGN